MARREKIQANFGATRKGRSPQESAGTLVGAREDEKNDQLQKQWVIDIGGGVATGMQTPLKAPNTGVPASCKRLRVAAESEA